LPECRTDRKGGRRAPLGEDGAIRAACGVRTITVRAGARRLPPDLPLRTEEACAGACRLAGHAFHHARHPGHDAAPHGVRGRSRCITNPPAACQSGPEAVATRVRRRACRARSVKLMSGNALRIVSSPTMPWREHSSPNGGSGHRSPCKLEGGAVGCRRRPPLRPMAPTRAPGPAVSEAAPPTWAPGCHRRRSRSGAPRWTGA
jgi:hypothetical protein